MNFESKVRRTLWFNLWLGLVPDAAIALSVAHLTGSGAAAFIATFVGLQLLYIAMWLKTLAWSWLLFWLKGRKGLSQAFLQSLRASRMPEPKDYEESADSYFVGVMDSEGVPIGTRLSAAQTLGSLKTLSQLGRVSLAIQMSIALEDSLESYKREFR